MDNSRIILRLKKTIIYTEKVLENFPKKEFVLKNRIIDMFYNILELTHEVYIDRENKTKIIKKILVKIRMLDFYLQIYYQNANHYGLKQTHQILDIYQIKNRHY